jgi:glycosyltransferase involved in cell wall biosynthesis
VENEIRQSWVFGNDGVSEQVTVVIPVFNQERVIRRNLQSLVASLTLPSRIIVINDGSRDETEQAVLETFVDLEELNPELTFELHSLSSGCYETACDSLGIGLARTRWLIEVQADMTISDPGFDKRLLDAMRAYPDIFAISGRGVEPISPVLASYKRSAGSDQAKGQTLLNHCINTLVSRLRPFQSRAANELGPKPIDHATNGKNKEAEIFPDWNTFQLSGRAGRVGSLIEHAAYLRKPRREVWIGETIMRGPLLMDLDKYFKIGGLDSKAFFQGFDEHDLMLRARQAGYKVGFSHVEFESPLAVGTTRKMKAISTELSILKQLWRIQSHRQRSLLFRVANGSQLPPASSLEIRRF